MTRRPMHADDAVTIWHANALALPLPDASVDLVVTSPPYFALRSYTDDGQHYPGQVGSEPTPTEYVDALIAATAEMVRVLKPTGSIWVNLADKYSGAMPRNNQNFNERSGNAPGRRAQENQRYRTDTSNVWAQMNPRNNGIPAKSLLGLPWRYALRVVDELGLILRRDQIWNKPNGLPESVTDRTRSSHEYVFHFVKRPDYYSAVDEIREPVAFPEQSRTMGDSANGGKHSGALHKRQDGGANPLGKLPGSVWTIPTQPLSVPWGYGVEAGRITRYFPTELDAIAWLRRSTHTRRRRIRALPDHFAAFPLELPRRIIRGWSPSGICTECGEGRRPISVGEEVPHWKGGTKGARNGSTDRASELRTNTLRTITGESCACPAPTAPIRPSVVLDPFGGTGTTGLVARAENRHAWLTDLSLDYCRLARWRITDPSERARAMQLPKPPPTPTDTDTLFNLAGDL